MANRTAAPRARKDDFYVRVSLPDGGSQWFPATDFLHSDKPMPFNKPMATCAVRVFDDVVCFSHLLIRKKASAEMAEKSIAMPSGALTRLAKRSAELGNTGTDTLLVERSTEDGDRNLTNELYVFSVTRDENNIVSLDLLDVTDEQAAANVGDVPAMRAAATSAGEEDISGQRDPIVLSRRAEKISVYFRSPKVDRAMAISWIGHFGRPPGDPETVTRAAAMILNAMRDLPTFATLASIEQARVPALAGATAAAPAQQVSKTEFTLPVSLYDESEQPLGAGDVTVEFDLTALVATELQLPYQLVPDESIAEALSAEHANQLEWAVRSEMLRKGRSDIESVAFDVTLGEVEDGTVERLASVFAAALPGVHLAPDKYVTYEQVAPPAVA